MRAPATDRRSAALLAAATLLAAVALNLPFLATYAVRGDTAALLLHSTRFFPLHPAEWLRSGFSSYFVNYPEATRPYTGFVRPVVNASFWLESLLARTPGSPLFLLTNYLGHAACAGLVYLLARRAGGLAHGRALLAAALFAGTLAALELLHSPAFRADMLGAGFAAAALLAADRWLRGGGGGWVAAACALLVLAVLSKETAVPAALLCAGWVAAARGSERARPRSARAVAAVLLLLPLGVFALVRLLGPHGVYTSLAGARGNLAEGGSSLFFPGAGVLELLTVLRGREPAPAESLRVLVGFALNLGFAALALHALYRRRPGVLPLVLLAAGATAIPALLAPLPRMLYFAQMFTLPLLVAVLPAARAPRRVLAGLALAVGPAAFALRLALQQPRLVAENWDALRLEAALAAELRAPGLRRLYLVNDEVGEYGAAALLRMAALRAGRPEVVTRVTNSLGLDGRGGTLETRRILDGVLVEQRCGARCDFAFPGLAAGDERRLGVERLIYYPLVERHHLVFVIPSIDCDYALLGFSPARDGVQRLAACMPPPRRDAHGAER